MIATCAKCGHGKKVHWNKESQKWLCDSCRVLTRYHNTEFHEVCCFCGEKKHVASRISRARLQLILKEEQKRGLSLSDVNGSTLKTDKRPVCQNCNRSRIKLGSCMTCGNTSVPIAMRSKDSKAICTKCYNSTYKRRQK